MRARSSGFAAPQTKANWAVGAQLPAWRVGKVVHPCVNRASAAIRANRIM